MANIVIDIAAEFTGKNAFKSAETSTDKLTKNIKSMAKTLGVAFSATAVLSFAKASVKAAAADEKAQKQLALALKNVGLGRDVAASEAFIQKLQSEFGVVDDKLRPAYQQLAVATGDTAQSQKLLQIALDISASTGRDLASVTGAISKAYLGNNTALGKLGVGISKADLKAKSFDEIMNQLSTTFAGSATQSANTFQGSMDKLSVASANVQEIIGKGIIDALKGLSEDTTVDDLAKGMEDFALFTADAIRGVGVLLEALKSIPAAVNLPGLKFAMQATGLGILSKIGEAERKKQEAAAARATNGLAHLAELEAKYANITLKASTKLTAEELKQLKAKQLKAAIDKANLALGKGSNVFDIEKIQLAAAEKNAAEQLGKVTSQAQLLQITNDLARLEVKQSILDLEEAIKSNDVAAITNATAKLNADLKVLGVLTNQEIKVRDIKSILESILPVDLINLANLDAAIAKLKFIGGGGVSTAAVAGTGAGSAAPTLLESLAAGSFVPVVAGTGGVMGGSSRAGNYAPSGFPGASGNTIIVNTGVGDPNAIAEAIDQVLRDATDRGTLRSLVA
jgi:glycosyltransferase involved in cell wall biosynthesis